MRKFANLLDVLPGVLRNYSFPIFTLTGPLLHLYLHLLRQLIIITPLKANGGSFPQFSDNRRTLESKITLPHALLRPFERHVSYRLLIKW